MDDITRKLFVASGSGSDRHNFVHDLIEKGAQVNAKHSNGARPLHLAARKGHLKIAGELLERGAKVDARNKNGETALFAAADRGNAFMVSALIRHKADFTLPNHDGEMPIDRARANGHSNVVKLLEGQMNTALATLPEKELQRRHANLEKAATLLEAELRRRETQKGTHPSR